MWLRLSSPFLSSPSLTETHKRTTFSAAAAARRSSLIGYPPEYLFSCKYLGQFHKPAGRHDNPYMVQQRLTAELKLEMERHLREREKTS